MMTGPLNLNKGIIRLVFIQYFNGLGEIIHSYFKFCLFQSCVKMFGAGYVIQALIKLVSSVGRVLKQPKTVIHALFNRNNTQLGAFLGLFVGTYKVSGYYMSGQKSYPKFAP